MRPTVRRTIACAVVASVVGRSAVAQVGAPPAGGPAAAYLDVLRTRSDLQQAAAGLARADALAARDMLSPSERDDRRADYERARIAHLGALLAATAGGHVAVERAVKARTPDGRVRVTLTLRDDRPAPPIAATARDSADGAAIGAWAAARDATIALKTDAGPNGTTISRPYERRVSYARPGERRVVEFDLLEDVADVVVAIDAAGRIDERRIRLEIASARDGLTVDAAQFSLAADLGAQVVYDLRLQRPRPRAGATRLAVRGLPAEAAYEFRDADSHTRLGQLRFADGSTAARVQLAVSLPARPSPAVRPDAPVAFDVVAADDGGGAAAEGRARLELVPRGIARLELRPAALAMQARDDGPTTLALLVRNAGTGRVDDVRLRVEPPPRWQASFDPAAIATLAPGDERRVRLALHPPADAVGGDYELRVGIDDAGSAQRIEVEDKLIRVRVGGGGLATPLLVVGAALGLTLVVVTRGRRWVNR